jgi:integrase/recombinase XerD
VADVHFGRGPFGKLHVRYGKAARGSGPRPRWVPMLDQLDLVLRWYVNDVRSRFGDGLALFCDEAGGRMHKGSVRNRLAHLLKLEGRPAAEGFTPHGLRHACATRNYERGVRQRQERLGAQQRVAQLDSASARRASRRAARSGTRRAAPEGKMASA